MVAVSNQSPIAVANASTLVGPAPLAIEFTSNESSDDKGIVSYLWNFGTGDISTLPNPTYVFEFAGTFEVTLTVADGEGLESMVSLFIEISDNIGYVASMENIVIAPNPAVDYTEVFINLESQSKLLGLYVYNVNGKLVRKMNFVNSNYANGSFELYVGDLSNGIYSVYAYVIGLSKPLVSKMIVKNQ